MDTPPSLKMVVIIGLVIGILAAAPVLWLAVDGIGSALYLWESWPAGKRAAGIYREVSGGMANAVANILAIAPIERSTAELGGRITIIVMIAAILVLCLYEARAHIKRCISLFRDM